MAIIVSNHRTIMTRQKSMLPGASGIMQGPSNRVGNKKIHIQEIMGSMVGIQMETHFMH